MNQLKLFKLFLFAFTLVAFSNCGFIDNATKNTATAKEFSASLLNKDYDKCLSLTSLENKALRNVNKDTLKKQLDFLRNRIVKNFGENIEFSFMSSNKTTHYTIGIPENQDSNNVSTVMLQFQNQNQFGMLGFTFDDSNNKVLGIRILDVKADIPSLNMFWIFCVAGVFILGFLIYTLIKIKRSKLKKKYLYVIAVLLLNVPTVTCNALTGISIKLLNFQFLLGVSFAKMGHIDTFCSLGVPLGAIFALWRIRKKYREPQQSLQENNIVTPDETNPPEV